MEPKVSVIIPTHNRPQLLERALRSVASQTFKDFEILVVQNGANQDSKVVVERLAAEGTPIRYLYEPKPDPCHARNVGIRASRGQYIAFLDDDDEWLPEKLKRQVEVMGRSPNVGLVTCGIYYIDDTNGTTKTPSFKETVSFKAFVTEGNLIWTLSSVLIRRECFDRVGLFDSRYPIANDYDLYLRLIKEYGFFLVIEPLLRYHRHHGGLSKDLKRSRLELVTVLESLRSEPKLGVSKRCLGERIASHYHSMGVDAYDAGERMEAAGLFLKAVISDPWIGNRISWGRFSNPVYRTLRPYLATLYCGLSLMGPRRLGKKQGVA